MNRQTVLKLNNVAVYQDKTPVLENINISLHKGEFAYLIGKTGSGKTSLLKSLYGALPLQKGDGEVCGFDLSKLNKKNIPLLRRRMGIVFQDFNLLADRNVVENLIFVLKATGWKNKNEMNEKIDAVLQSVGMQNAHLRMPHQLSGGEQQRIVIARALLNEPDLIIADEPTGNLDPETSDDILSLLRDLSKNKNTAVLLATHDYRILQHFPARIIRCQDNRVFDEQNFLI